MGGGGGKEGDWECSRCENRNYAFRSFCNRCKQPRLLVDCKTPADSKWLPRIGDWICSGCTNNNYASREKCKKCGQPKQQLLASMPAGASHPTYFARAHGGGGGIDQILPLSSNWPIGGSSGQYGFQPSSNWPLPPTAISYANQINQLPPVPNGNEWRSGDWICSCGFHNYSSRLQCKKCNAPTQISMPSSLISAAVTALGTKRVASEEFIHNWDNKRLNAGQEQTPGFGSFQSVGGSQLNSIYPGNIPSGNNAYLPNLQVNFQIPNVPLPPAVLGKGAKQWRDGDWMCSNCNNHNYASRAECNRCKSQREVPPPQAERWGWWCVIAIYLLVTF
ncbi:hypothetical protein MIMGU_mgv1a009717mg [Erythranthe guttata]|uniref:RanBP2-type domain-containing protein n=1 Tax=Erythranthe guttata TaxID=4155 RepID=A0A022PXH7_ERYGU|nr:hypothetical protein MIMGU_mgv1a009717mg [Erythranthe guttata]